MSQIIEKLDTVHEAVANTDRATPQYSPAQNGDAEIKRLENLGCFHVFEPKVDEASVLTSLQQGYLERMETEHQVVAYLTPFIEDIVRNETSNTVCNSEEYQWLDVGDDTKYNQKPDMLICHHALLALRRPFKSQDKKLGSMRRSSDKFGILSHWRLRNYIGAICEAKMKLSNQSFGEVINYGAHVCFGHHGAEVARLILFDKKTFWLVQSVRGKVSDVQTCRWVDGGSSGLLRNFIQQPVLMKLVNEACQKFNVTIEQNAFLGAGAFGFVFHVKRNERSLALKICLKGPKYSGAEHLESEMRKTNDAKRKCPEVVLGVEDQDHGFLEMDDGGALLLSGVGEHYSKLRPQAIVDSLEELHKNNILHGDARPENVICLNERACWIDFAASYSLGLPLNEKAEMQQLVTCVNEKFKCKIQLPEGY